MHTIDKLALENCTKNLENSLSRILSKNIWEEIFRKFLYMYNFPKSIYEAGKTCTIFSFQDFCLLDLQRFFREWINSYRKVYTLLPSSSVIHVSNGKCNACLVILHELADGAPSSIVSNEFLLCIRAVSFVLRLSIDIVTCYYRLRGEPFAVTVRITRAPL